MTPPSPWTISMITAAGSGMPPMRVGERVLQVGGAVGCRRTPG